MIRRNRICKNTKQVTLYFKSFPVVERKKENYSGYPAGNIYKPEELPPPNCKYQRISLVNSYRYCGYPKIHSAYCIYEIGNSGQCFDCPLGIPRIYPLKY